MKGFNKWLCAFFLIVVPLISQAADLVLTEYYHAGLDLYVATASPGEQAVLDQGTVVPGWARTGAQMLVYSVQVDGSVPVCQFFGNQGTVGRFRSYLYTSDPQECQRLKSDLGWIDGGVPFYALVPVNGACFVDLKPVYRGYNNTDGRQDNYRFLSGGAGRDIFSYLAKERGWVLEKKVFCSAYATDSGTLGLGIDLQPGEVRIANTLQVLRFRIDDKGNVGPVWNGGPTAPPVSLASVKEACYWSNRAGWATGQATCQPLDAMGQVLITGTPNNDRDGTWALNYDSAPPAWFSFGKVTKTEGDCITLETRWKICGKDVSVNLTNFTIQYGGYQPSQMKLEDANTLTLHFNLDGRFAGFINIEKGTPAEVDLELITSVRYLSDTVGWDGADDTRPGLSGVISQDESGYIARFTGHTFDSEIGNLALYMRKADGTDVRFWFGAGFCDKTGEIKTTWDCGNITPQKLNGNFANLLFRR